MLPNVVEIINIKVNVNNVRKNARLFVCGCFDFIIVFILIHQNRNDHNASRIWYKLIACSAKLLHDYATLHKAHYKLENCSYHHFIVWFMVCIRLMSYIAKTYIMVLHMTTAIKVTLSGRCLFVEYLEYWMNKWTLLKT